MTPTIVSSPLPLRDQRTADPPTGESLRSSTGKDWIKERREGKMGNRETRQRVFKSRFVRNRITVRRRFLTAVSLTSVPCWISTAHLVDIFYGSRADSHVVVKDYGTHPLYLWIRRERRRRSDYMKSTQTDTKILMGGQL